MVFLRTLLVAISTYSAIPVPQFHWDDRYMRYAICCFPAVGVFCAAALLLWNWFCTALGVGPVLFAAVAVCLPLLITGGIHMDGYMDTVDALASHQTRERKLEILKDSTCGAFAVLYCGVYLLAAFGLFHAVYEQGIAASYAAAYLFSRCLSALCAVTMPNARRSGMLCAFTEHVHKRKAVIAIAVLLILTGGLLLWQAPVAFAFAVIWCLWYRKLAMKQFGGATGDTAGFFLQLCEMAALLGVWIGGLL
jgi:adenosylcobinamide-GDP ribazoletransferase